MEIWPGQPFPLGATFDGAGTNFSLFSEAAERVELCIIDDDGIEQRIDVNEQTALIWHLYLPGVEPGIYLHRIKRPLQQVSSPISEWAARRWPVRCHRRRAHPSRARATPLMVSGLNATAT